jgi:hypothetical protein
MKRTAKQHQPSSGEKHLERVRRICMELPETMEKLSHGEPTFFVRKKVFVSETFSLTRSFLLERLSRSIRAEL